MLVAGEAAAAFDFNGNFKDGVKQFKGWQNNVVDILDVVKVEKGFIAYKKALQIDI